MFSSFLIIERLTNAIQILRVSVSWMLLKLNYQVGGPYARIL